MSRGLKTVLVMAISVLAYITTVLLLSTTSEVISKNIVLFAVYFVLLFVCRKNYLRTSCLSLSYIICVIPAFFFSRILTNHAWVSFDENYIFMAFTLFYLAPVFVVSLIISCLFFVLEKNNSAW